jgi:hypothetical protein
MPATRSAKTKATATPPDARTTELVKKTRQHEAKVVNSRAPTDVMESATTAAPTGG